MWIKEPNLPDKPVKKVVVSGREKTIINNLRNSGIEVVEVPVNNYIEPKISSHADMNILHLGENNYIAYKPLLNEAFNHILEPKPYKNDYFNSTKLNLALFGKFCVCNKKTATQYIDKIDKTKIYVNQGYAKCSTLIINSDSIITGDTNIYKKCSDFGINVLLVDNRMIFINGYSNGFIGGVGGKIAPDILAVSGRINDMIECDNIKSFCRNVGVYIEELTKDRLTDIGGIIPIEIF